MPENLDNSQKCIIFVLSKQENINNMDKQALLKYWAGELLAVKMELEKIAFLIEEGVEPPRELDEYLDRMLDRKQMLEQLIEEIRNQK